MTDYTPPPQLSKWPFYFSDLLLLLLAVLILYHFPHPLGPWPLLILVFCVIAGAGFAIAPFLTEYRAALKLAESNSLINTVAQIENLQTVGEQIRIATAQWQMIHEQAALTATAAKEIAERMRSEAQTFGEFMQKSNDAEKARLRLEVDKLRRGEGEWLQILIHLLDHIFALYQAGARAGQPALSAQLRTFQSACRDAARRVGLVPFEAQVEQPFDEKTHALVDTETKPPPNARICETIATGYTFQGQLLRRALVSIKDPLSVTQESEIQITLPADVSRSNKRMPEPARSQSD